MLRHCRAGLHITALAALRCTHARLFCAVRRRGDIVQNNNRIEEHRRVRGYGGVVFILHARRAAPYATCTA
jgi:hypothetical protein